MLYWYKKTNFTDLNLSLSYFCKEFIGATTREKILTEFFETPFVSSKSEEEAKYRNT